MVVRTAALFLSLAVAAVHPALQAIADDPLPQPEGRVILTVSGNITRTNAGDRAEFDLDMLHALGTEAVSVTTSWTDEQDFSGVLMRDLLAAVGAKGKTVEAVALSDYTYSINIEDFADYPVIIATKLHGKILKVRDKGPLWIIYPLDRFAEHQRPSVERRMVWQLRQLIVR